MKKLNLPRFSASLNNIWILLKRSFFQEVKDADWNSLYTFIYFFYIIFLIHIGAGISLIFEDKNTNMNSFELRNIFSIYKNCNLKCWNFACDPVNLTIDPICFSRLPLVTAVFVIITHLLEISLIIVIDSYVFCIENIWNSFIKKITYYYYVVISMLIQFMNYHGN